jgi:hypothetical protein
MAFSKAKPTPWRSMICGDPFTDVGDRVRGVFTPTGLSSQQIGPRGPLILPILRCPLLADADIFN